MIECLDIRISRSNVRCSYWGENPPSDYNKELFKEEEQH